MFTLVDGPLDVGTLVSNAQRPECGAIVTFVGTTRVDESEGASVEYLEYEAYRPMADRKLEEIGAEIEGRWNVEHVSIVHRLGRVDPGEASVAIVVGAPRRGPAIPRRGHVRQPAECPREGLGGSGSPRPWRRR